MDKIEISKLKDRIKELEWKLHNRLTNVQLWEDRENMRVALERIVAMEPDPYGHDMRDVAKNALQMISKAEGK